MTFKITWMAGFTCRLWPWNLLWDHDALTQHMEERLINRAIDEGSPARNTIAGTFTDMLDHPLLHEHQLVRLNGF